MYRCIFLQPGEVEYRLKDKNDNDKGVENGVPAILIFFLFHAYIYACLLIY